MHCPESYGTDVGEDNIDVGSGLLLFGLGILPAGGQHVVERIVADACSENRNGWLHILRKCAYGMTQIVEYSAKGVHVSNVIFSAELFHTD